MRLYETAFLIAPNISDEETELLIQQMADIVTEKKGKLHNIDKWGKRKLAYPIKKFEAAFYAFLLYEGTADIPLELERRFKQNEGIIRFLTVKRDPKVEIKSKDKKPAVKKPAKEDDPPVEKKKPAAKPEAPPETPKEEKKEPPEAPKEEVKEPPVTPEVEIKEPPAPEEEEKKKEE